MITVFTIAYTVWIVSEVLLNRLMRSKTNDSQNKDKNSLRLIWITIIVSITLSVWISMNYYFPISESGFVPYLGVALIFTGVLLRLMIIKSLGKFFTVDVAINKNHALKKDGFYKYLRHPSYFASLISFVGFGLSLNNWVSLLIVVLAIFISFINRIKIEERALIEYFGDEYLHYRKSTKGIIPFIY